MFFRKLQDNILDPTLRSKFTKAMATEAQYAQHPDLVGKRVLITGERCITAQHHVPIAVTAVLRNNSDQVVASINLTMQPLLGSDVCRLAGAGSSSGIGKAVALAFATQNSDSCEQSTKICVMSRSQARLQKVVEDIEKLGAQGFAVAGDLTHASDCQAALEEAVSHSCRMLVNSLCLTFEFVGLSKRLLVQASLMGGLDVLVNNGKVEHACIYAYSQAKSCLFCMSLSM